jgi:hypothetical protein
MKVRRLMVAIIHADNYAVEAYAFASGEINIL